MQDQREMAHPFASKGISTAKPRHGHAGFTLMILMNPPTSPCPPFLLVQNLSPKTLPEVTGKHGNSILTT